jgi:hypothetical protein
MTKKQMKVKKNVRMIRKPQTFFLQGGDVLNIGFGMGIVDSFIQARSPRTHTIIEAHPGVHQRMLDAGWADRPGVRVVFGRWQDVIDQVRVISLHFPFLPLLSSFFSYGSLIRR